ncbi:hypothetical protein C0992_006907, partial [Termitomyces sp. T32_za158]
DFHDLMNRGMDPNCQDLKGWTALHHAVFSGNMDMVIALVEQQPALISAQAELYGISACTVLDFATCFRNSDMVTYLLDHGAKSSSHNSLYHMLHPKFKIHVYRIEFLLGCGWDRTVKDAEGKTLLDIAHNKNDIALVEHLEHYQTVRLPSYGTILHVGDEEAP